MITAIDTNVLLDVFTASHEPSRESLREVHRAGGLVIGEIVFAELCAGFSSDLVLSTLDELAIAMVASSKNALGAAGQMWRSHLRSGGRRSRILPDFLVGAHALYHADRLLTRDRGFYRDHFKGLKLVEP